MAVSRKGKIIIGISIAVLAVIVTIVSVLATRKDTPEVTVVKVETKRELRSTVTASGEVRPIQFINLTVKFRDESKKFPSKKAIW